jgi:hypothetical protein
MYHLLQGINELVPINKKLVIVFKVADCAMIHCYTTICNIGITRHHRMRFSTLERIGRQGSHLINISCIVNMVREPKILDDVMFSMLRICAIGTLSSSTLSRTNQRVEGTLYGTLCALLYMVDSKLANFGHCLFHLVLGGLHHTIYNCISETKKREDLIPISPLVNDEHRLSNIY